MNAVLSRKLGYFKFGFDPSLVWLHESSNIGKKLDTHPVERARDMEGLIDGKAISSFSDLARHLRISRARVSQIMNLLKLDPEIQKYLSSLPAIELHRYTERSLRNIASIQDQKQQMSEFGKLKRRLNK